jgi:predicted ribosomally synthesized peptide with SipW-like signal peptide
MIRTLVSLVLATTFVVGTAGIATWAFFTDTEQSTDNVFTAGILDMKTNDDDGVSHTLDATGMAPGDTIGPSTIALRNSGNLGGTTLDISFSYVENDGSPNLVDISADDMAAMIEVITLNYDGANLLGSLSDNNANTYIDFEDLINADLSGLSGLDTTISKDFEIAAQFRSEVGNEYQADGISMNMTFVLNQ